MNFSGLTNERIDELSKNVIAANEVMTLAVKDLAVGYRLAGGIVVNQYSGGMLDGWRVTHVAKGTHADAHYKIGAKHPETSESVVLYLNAETQVAIYHEVINTKDLDYDRLKTKVVHWMEGGTPPSDSLTFTFARLLLSLCEQVEKLASHVHNQTDVNASYYGITTGPPRGDGG